MKRISILLLLWLCTISCNIGGDGFIGKWKDEYAGIDQFGDGAYIKWLVIAKWGDGYKVSYHYGGNTNPPFIDFVATAAYKQGVLDIDDNVQVPEGYSLRITYNEDTLFYNGDKYVHVADDAFQNRE